MIFFPNCKINLGLQVLSRLENGYHTIESVMIPIPLCDVLELIPSTDGNTRLVTSGNTVDCPPEKNLVVKAYNAVKEIYPQLPPTHIYLRKIIPDGAGLGGGSSDAAFTITGLNTLYNIGLSEEKMEHIASTIGADCPFFIRNRAALATGTGTELTPVPNPIPKGYVILLAKPDESVSTKAAYAGITPDNSRPSIIELLNSPIHQWQGKIQNDFEKTVGKEVPRILEIKDFFIKSGAVYTAMSGSGSAVFAIFKPEDADRIPSSIPEKVFRLE